MDLAVISDTHIPARQSEIPEQFRERIAAADHTIHAGDFETTDALAEIRDLAEELTAVYGNLDPRGIGLPGIRELSVEGITFVITHGTLNHVEAAVYDDDGMVMSPDGWADAIADTARARTRAWDGDGIVGIGGHTHTVENTTHEGVRLLNPGSATGADPADRATMMTVAVEAGEIDVRLHEI
jgi:putative phosphoesterase